MPDFVDIPINATAEELEAVARMGTAPEDGKAYGRKNGEWVEVINTVEQDYNPDSANAQSGKAVAEAVAEAVNPIMRYIDYSISNGEVTITGCDTSISGDYEIPEKIEGYPVTEIGATSFENCDRIKSIIIPDSVTSIGRGAFFGNALIHIFLPVSVIEIGVSAFSGDGTITDVYYTGTQNDWGQINIHSGNSDLLNATIHYNQRPAIMQDVLDNSSPIKSISQNGTPITPDSSGNVNITGGGGGTVDQTYDPTSKNAQSGTAVAEAVANFITNTVDNLTNYYLKSETYNKTEVNNLIGAIQTAHFEVVNVLPPIGENNVIYLILRSDPETSNIYDEYIYINNAYEKIGSTDVDLTGYATETWVSQQISGFLTQAQIESLITTALASYYTSAQTDAKLAEKVDKFDLLASIDYELNTNQDGVVILGRKSSVSADKFIGEIVIPETITINNVAYPVVGLGVATGTVTTGFTNCTKITGVSIPPTVTYIGKAFFRNTGITDVYLPYSVSVIGEQAFHSCGNLSDIVIENSACDIEEFAFYGTGISKIAFGSGMTAITQQTCRNCYQLKKVFIPKPITAINSNAFKDSSSQALTNITDVYFEYTQAEFNNLTAVQQASLTTNAFANTVTYHYGANRAYFDYGIALATKGELAQKLTEPSSGLAVGKYFRIASIDNDGHAVLECVDLPEQIFVATYGVTTYSEIAEARNADKEIICIYQNIIYRYSTVVGDGHTFVTLRSTSQAYSIAVTSNNVWVSGTTDLVSNFNYRNYVKSAMTDGQGAAEGMRSIYEGIRYSGTLGAEALDENYLPGYGGSDNITISDPAFNTYDYFELDFYTDNAANFSARVSKLYFVVKRDNNAVKYDFHDQITADGWNHVKIPIIWETGTDKWVLEGGYVRFYITESASDTGAADRYVLANIYATKDVYTWTDAEKNSCYNKITIRKTTLDSVLVPNAKYDLGSTEQTSVTLTLPTPGGTDNYSCNEIYVTFKSGSTATTLSIVGTYAGDTSYVPSANSICELSFKYVCGTWVLVAKDTPLTNT